MDDEGLEGSRVPRVSDLTGFRSDATESIAVGCGGFDWNRWALKSARSRSFSDDEQTLIWLSNLA